MSKFKDTLKIIEEGLLKPMTDIEIKEVDAERVKERVDEILSRSTKNADGSIDVEGDVYLDGLNLKKLPLKFNKVDHFYCDNNQLTSLEGAPKEVSCGFYCWKNHLTSLEGAPKEVGGDFDCSFNQLTSLEGAPKEVDDNFWCHHNKVKFTKKQVRAVCNVKGGIYV